MVKKIYIILTILIFSSFVFSACSAQTMIESRLKELNEIIPGDEERVNETFDNMAEAIANKDEDELKALFSETALKEADGFEEDMQIIFDIFNGEKFERENGSEDGWTKDEEIVDGEKTTLLSSWFKIHREGKTYTFYIVDVLKDTNDRKNEGVKTICVINRGDSIRYYEDFEGAHLPGIHYEPNE